MLYMYYNYYILYILYIVGLHAETLSLLFSTVRRETFKLAKQLSLLRSFSCRK